MADSSCVSIGQIAEKLHVSRNFIHMVMLPHIPHEKTKTKTFRVAVEQKALRQWLKENSEFSRQTVLVHADPAAGLLSSVPPSHQRKQLPFRYVKPFDYWDLPLLFPDDDRFAHTETFYRAMYACGAIKIKLGARKSMFYAPDLRVENLARAEAYRSPYGIPNIEMKQGTMALMLNKRLCPAMDDPREGDIPTEAERQQLADRETVRSINDTAISIGIRGRDKHYVESVTQLIKEIIGPVSCRGFNGGTMVQIRISEEIMRYFLQGRHKRE